MSDINNKKFQTAKTKMDAMKEKQARAGEVSNSNDKKFKTVKSNTTKNDDAYTKRKFKNTEYTHIRISKETKDVLEDIRHALRKIDGSNVTANDLVKEGLNLICEKQGIDISKYQ